MTPKEYKMAYKYFQKPVVYLSEHSKSYNNTKQLSDKIDKKTDLIILRYRLQGFR